MKPNQKKTLKLAIVIPVLLLAVWLCTETGYQRFSIGAICPKCLQRASIREKRIHGVTIYRSIRLDQSPGEIMSSAALGPAQPEVSPALYEQFLGRKCDHVFKRGGFGRTSGFLLGHVHADGIYMESSWFAPRIEAVESLYLAFVNSGSEGLARRTYAIIDTAIPIGNDEHMQEARALLRRQDHLPLDQAEQYFPEAARVAREMLRLEGLTARLKEIETEQQWLKLLSVIDRDFAPEPASQLADLGLLGFLSGPPPTAQTIDLDTYRKLKSAYLAKGGQVSPPGHVTYRTVEDDDWRSHMLCLVSFDDRWATVGELTSYKSKQHGWEWVASYRIARNPAVDEEFGIPDIVAKRSRVIGGVTYGMTVAELLARKGMHFKAASHQMPGACSFFFEDVIVTVKGWRPGTQEGSVVRVKPVTEFTQQYKWLGELPYEDER